MSAPTQTAVSADKHAHDISPAAEVPCEMCYGQKHISTLTGVQITCPRCKGSGWQPAHGSTPFIPDLDNDDHPGSCYLPEADPGEKEGESENNEHHTCSTCIHGLNDRCTHPLAVENDDSEQSDHHYCQHYEGTVQVIEERECMKKP